MSSHREAPEISKDPVADNTDLYAFVDPNDATKVTILSNFIPLEEPAGGPNFFQFGDDVLYEIMIDNNGDGVEDVTYQLRFMTTRQNPDTFLYNVGPIGSLTDAAWNIRQKYSVTRVVGPRRTGSSTLLASDLPSPPVRIGPRSTPSYEALVSAALAAGTIGDRKFFAGQRDEGFYVDLGSIFDLGTLRPFQNFHLIDTPAAPGEDDTKGYNVHTIAMQVPKTDLSASGAELDDPEDPTSVIGIWTSASRRKAMVRETGGRIVQSGPWVQVSRLGNPLINEVLAPVGKKDYWNSQHPKADSQFVQYYETPELQVLLPILYPGVFPNLAGITSPRADLVAILLTGVPAGLIGGWSTFTGAVQSDQLRLNLAIDPTVTDFDSVVADSAARLGILGGDLAGFPNGRRPFDDTVDIELRVVAGAVFNLVSPGYTPDAAAGALADRVPEPLNEVAYLEEFPYLSHPNEGYEHSHD